MNAIALVNNIYGRDRRGLIFVAHYRNKTRGRKEFLLFSAKKHVSVVQMFERENLAMVFFPEQSVLVTFSGQDRRPGTIGWFPIKLPLPRFS